MDGEVSSNYEDKQLELRRKRWDVFYHKYEKRGTINIEECYFSDVSYKMFKSVPKTKFKLRKNRTLKVKKNVKKGNNAAIGHNVYKGEISESTVTSTNLFTNVDVSCFIDEDSNDVFIPCDTGGHITLKDIRNSYETESLDSGLEMSDKAEEMSESDSPADTTLTENNNSNSHSICAEIHSEEGNRLHKLVDFIEKELKSNLRVILKNRSVSQLLDSEDYSYWHKCAKQEMTRLEKYISRNDLVEYMKHCYNANVPEGINVTIIQDVIVGNMKSNIKTLFLKREFTRHDKNKYLKYSEKIFLEWQRLCEVMPLDYLLFYGTSLVSSIKKQKKGSLLSDKELN